jgi:hemerythrin
MRYQWDGSLATNHELIDSQHKQLFEAVNKLLEACEQGRTGDELKKSLDFLTDYTIKHFFDEEQLQQASKYPDFENHKKYHTDFKSDVRNMSVELIMKGPTPELVTKVQKQVGDWLINHIKIQDFKLAAHIKAQQQAAH